MALFSENGFALSSEGADTFITNDVITTGTVIWVDSVNGSNDTGTGSEGKPLATLAQAISNTTASNGDIIVIKAGHTETYAGILTVPSNRPGIKIYGLGNGSSAPNFIAAAATDLFLVQAPNAEINNLYFPAGTTATNTARINIDAANVRIKGCTFKCGAFDQDTITLTVNAVRPRIESCAFTVTASGPRYGISVENAAVVGLYLKDCAFDGGSYNWSVAAIFSAVAHLSFHYETITLTNDASISHTSTGAKGWISGVSADDGSTVSV